MISKRDLIGLKSGSLEYLPLTDGFKLYKEDKTGNIYLSRGGKRKYYLTDRFLNSLCSKKYSNNIPLIVYILTSLDKIIKRTKKNSITRSSLENLIEEIKGQI